MRILSVADNYRGSHAERWFIHIHVL